jgi:hypothetical protein
VLLRRVTEATVARALDGQQNLRVSRAEASMARTLRWSGIDCGTVLGLGIVAYALVYVLSQRLLDRDRSAS